MDAANKKIGAIVLAAGASVRMRQPKQLLEFEGKTLLRRAVETAIAADFSPVVVVLGANIEASEAEISSLPVKICVNYDWEKGMSESLKTGLRKLLEIEKDAAGALVMLCDQPLVDTDLLKDLVDKFQTETNLIAACEYSETVGVPAVFARELFAEILDLQDEGGAKKLIRKYAESVGKVFAAQAAFDIDTPADYEKLSHYAETRTK